MMFAVQVSAAPSDKPAPWNTVLGNATHRSILQKLISMAIAMHGSGKDAVRELVSAIAADRSVSKVSA